MDESVARVIVKSMVYMTKMARENPKDTEHFLAIYKELFNILVDKGVPIAKIDSLIEEVGGNTQ
jgi:hypothetical protein